MPILQLPDGPIPYEDTGAGRPVVLVHGALVDGRLWREVVPALARECRVIVPTLPLGAHRGALRAGAELSPPALARMVAALLDELELEDAVLVGSDTGGAVVQLVAAAHPARLGGLVLLPCDTEDNFPPAFFRPLRVVPRIPGGVAGLAQVMRLKPLWRLPMVFGWLTKRPIDEALLRDWLRPLHESADVRRDVAKLLPELHPRHLAAAAPGLRAFGRPVVLCWAREDRLFPPREAERLAARFPDARIEWVEDSYTFVSLDQPAAVVASVRGLLAQIAESVAPA